MTTNCDIDPVDWDVIEDKTTNNEQQYKYIRRRQPNNS